jgi:hypothetical protein
MKALVIGGSGPTGPHVPALAPDALGTYEGGR